LRRLGFSVTHNGMRWSLPIGRVFGISLRLHVTFLIFLGFIAYVGFMDEGLNGAGWSVAMFVSIFACIAFHELGHSVVAQQLGVQVKSITLLPIGGVAALRSIPENPWHEIAITVAGPMVNAAIACVLIPFTGIPSHWLIMSMPKDIHGLLLSLAQANITLFIFNFIPAFPMDGGRLLRAVLALVLPYRQATTIAAMLGQGLAILFVLVGLKFSFWLVLIGAFIFLGAEGEERTVRMRSVLRDLNVEDVMSRAVATLSPSDPVSRGIELIYQMGQDDFPVLEEGRLVSILARSELVEAMNAQGANTPVSTIMKANVTLASPRDKLVHACEGIINGADTNAVVVVEDGQLVGMVSPENINRYLVLQSSIKSPRGLSRLERGRRARGTPPRLVISQSPAPPPVISGVPPIAAPQPPAGSVPPSGLV
jgi:Zn-dependent protease/CBS domain-containing protein